MRGKSWIDRMGEAIGQSAANKVIAEFDRGGFDHLIEAAIVRSTTNLPDEGLTRFGFVMKIAVELIEKSSPQIPFQRAKDMAWEVYDQFRRDNEMVKFGHPEWDWSGAAARELAHEYEIRHWEAHHEQ